MLWCTDVGWNGEQCEQELEGVRGRGCVIPVLGCRHAVDEGGHVRLTLEWEMLGT